jgi:hypothetical protein
MLRADVPRIGMRRQLLGAPSLCRQRQRTDVIDEARAAGPRARAVRAVTPCTTHAQQGLPWPLNSLTNFPI